jgi:predicted DNA-binding transcriptional regulator AlpA
MKSESTLQTHSPRYGRPKETAARYRCGVSTLYAWVQTRDGFPRPRKLGPRTTVFDWDAIDAFLLENSGR